MTRRDYLAIAAALKSARPPDLFTNSVARHTWYASVSAVAELFARENKRFDSSRFFDDCGVPT